MSWPLTHEQIEEWVRQAPWQVAKSMPENPHSYVLRKKVKDERLYFMVILHMREHGFIRRFGRRLFIMYDAAGHRLWTMGEPMESTDLINRKTLAQVEIDEAKYGKQTK